ncbi:MAG: hypothetical protein QOG45_564 [Chloroflexota bacterium]|jgi:hypothetical protein|nr:hypothetical protein [Chloroflexota bacterium]
MFRLPHVRRAWVGPLLLSALAVATFVPAAASSSPATATPAAASPAATDCGPPLKLDRKDFPNSPKVTNRYLPLSPGMQFVLDGVVLDDQNQPHPHQIVTTVTDLTKVVDGVRTLVVFDEDIQDGQTSEAEIFFVSQDQDGTVWTFGENPEIYENGVLTGAPSSWLSGVQGARAGIAMLAKPKVGTKTYLQGLAPKVDFKDCATVFKTGEKHVCVPVGCFDNVLEIDEFAPLDPAGGHQRKFYAPALGLIKVSAAGGVDPETLKLKSAERLCKGDLADIREKALEQDARAYTTARRVWAGSPHAQHTIDAKTC